MNMKRKWSLVFCALICLALVLPGCRPIAAEPKISADEAHALYHDAVDKLFASRQVAFDFYLEVVRLDPSAGEDEEVLVAMMFQLEWNNGVKGAELRLTSKAVLPEGGYEDNATTWYKDGVMRTAFTDDVFETQEQINTLEDFLRMQHLMPCGFSKDAIADFSAVRSDGSTALFFEMGEFGTVSGLSGISRDSSEDEGRQVTASIDAGGRPNHFSFITFFYNEDELCRQTVTIDNIRYSGVAVSLPEGFPNDDGRPQSYFLEENPSPSIFNFALFPGDEFPWGTWTVNSLVKTFGVPNEIFGNYVSRYDIVVVVLSYGNKSFISEPMPAERFSFHKELLANGRYELNESDKALELIISSIAIYDAELEFLPYNIKAGESTKKQIIETYGETPAYHYQGPGEMGIAGDEGLEFYMGRLNLFYYYYVFFSSEGTIPEPLSENNIGMIRYEFDENDLLIRAELIWKVDAFQLEA